MTILKPEEARRVIMRRDGSSTFSTLAAHFKRAGRDLSNCDLRGLDFSRMHLHGFNLQGCDLSSCKLAGTDLSGANLQGARLVGVTGPGAIFDNASLSQADLTGSELPGASFAGAELVGTNCEECVLSETVWHSAANVSRQSETGRESLDGFQLSTGARLIGVSFRQAKLRRARFSGPAGFRSQTNERRLVFRNRGEIMTEFLPASLATIDFRNADLTRATFGGANRWDGGMSAIIEQHIRTQGWFASAKVIGHERLPGNACEFTDCDFNGANLSDADLSQVKLLSSTFLDCELLNADFSFAVIDSETSFSPEFRLPDSAEQLPPPFSLARLIKRWLCTFPSQAEWTQDNELPNCHS